MEIRANEKADILQRYFGYSVFRLGQEEIIDSLEAQGYIEYVGVGRPILKVTDAGWLVLKGKAQVQAREALIIQTTVKESVDSAVNTELFEALRSLRSKIATSRGVPAFVIFSDATLKDMCIKMPTTDSEFLQVSGVGERKRSQYGERFMSVIKEYAPEKKIVCDSDQADRTAVNTLLLL